MNTPIYDPNLSDNNPNDIDTTDLTNTGDVSTGDVQTGDNPMGMGRLVEEKQIDPPQHTMEGLRTAQPHSVQYIGGAGTREITREQWKKIGINAPDMYWTAANNWSISTVNMPTEMIEYFRTDNGFVIH